LHHVTSCYYKLFLPASSISMPMRGGEKRTPAWALRKEALLRDCIVSPDVFTQMMDPYG
jgi:hypothetical protein